MFTQVNILNHYKQLKTNMLQKVQCRLHELVQNNELSNSELIQIIEQLGGYLNIETISDRARRLGVDYTIVKKSKVYKRVIFGVKFAIENG